MNVEHALLTVSEDRSEEFEAAFKAAQELIVKAEGCHFVDLLRQTGGRSTYLMIAAWSSHAAATAFVGSELHKQWSEQLTPFLTSTPETLYFDLLSHFPPEG